MATAKLTKTVVEAEPVGTADQYVWDTLLPRFGLRVTPAGARIYLVQYRAKPAAGEPAKTRRVSIGQHGKPWTVDKAREEAKRLLALVDLDRDPFAEREDARRARAVAAEAAAEAEHQAQRRRQDTYALAVDRFAKLELDTTTRSGQETARLLRYDPLPAWGERHIGSIRRADAAALVDGIRERSPAVARSTYDALNGFFAWCEERELIATSPLTGLTAPPRPDPRERVLTSAELRQVWLAASQIDYPYEPFLKLLVLTGQRRGEVAGMTWSELDLEAGEWLIPKERTKNGCEHLVHLSPEALEIVRGVQNTGDYLFPARGEGPIRGFSFIKRQLDGKLVQVRAAEGVEDPIEEWVVHDLRRTAATRMTALGVAPHIVERVLNHVSGTRSGLMKVYQHYDYLPERKAALLAWGSAVTEIVSGVAPPTNVVKLRA